MTPSVRINRSVALAAIVAFAASPALAQTSSTLGGSLGTFLQNIVDLLTNGVVRWMAILAVIATGAGWMFGHVDFRRAITVVGGIVVIFGAATIVDAITGGAHA